MQDHNGGGDSASDSGQYSEGEWEQLGGASSSRNGGLHQGAEYNDDGTGKKGSKSEQSIPCYFQSAWLLSRWSDADLPVINTIPPFPLIAHSHGALRVLSLTNVHILT